MQPPVPTKDPAAVEGEVAAIYQGIFGDDGGNFVHRAFGWAVQSFQGRYADYQPIDARYHDLEHTLQGTLCLARLLHSRHAANAKPVLSRRMVELGLLAILLHDTGYLKKRDDVEGTGAKYTLTHVHRSADFAAELLADKGFADQEITAVQNMICCTGVDAKLNAIPFQSEQERLVGFALGTADLLGQMAADDYVEKLPVLYSEFAEAARFSREQKSFIATFKSAEDLMSRTPIFWEQFVLPKLNHEYGGLFQFLNQPYPSGPNEYILGITENMQRLKEGFHHTHA